MESSSAQAQLQATESRYEAADNAKYSLKHSYSYWYLQKIMQPCCSLWYEEAVDADDYDLEASVAAIQRIELSSDTILESQDHLLGEQDSINAAVSVEVRDDREDDLANQMKATGSLNEGGDGAPQHPNSTSEQQERPEKVQAAYKPKTFSFVERQQSPRTIEEPLEAPRKQELLSFWDEKVRPLSVRSRQVFLKKPDHCAKTTMRTPKKASGPAAISSTNGAPEPDVDIATAVMSISEPHVDIEVVPRTPTDLDASSSTELGTSSGPGILQPEHSLISEETEQQAAELFTVLRRLSLEYQCTFSGVNDFNNYGDDAYMSKNDGRACAMEKSSVFSKECQLFQKWLKRAFFSKSREHVDVSTTTGDSKTTDLPLRQQLRSIAMAA
jgi:hypothetical protein